MPTDTPDVLKRLEEIEGEHRIYMTNAEQTDFLYRLTRALLKVQEELAHQLHHACGCDSCEELIARAERVRRGEL